LDQISEIELFELLKKDITKRFFETNSASSAKISDWKGQDIVTFQEDIFSKTKSTISEKWFYTYFKSDIKKLPRIDMLNILSQYAGYSSWSSFAQKHQNEEVLNSDEPEINYSKPIQAVPKGLTQVKPGKRKNYFWIGFSVFILCGLVGAGVYFAFFYQRTYEFCFVDADRNTYITDPIEIKIIREGFTPRELISENGCVAFKSMEDTLLMAVSSAYHKLDTFRINLHQYQGKENIRLEPDDYKVMLKYYSKLSQNAKERIKMLDEMISDNALIYQVYDNEYFGVEVLSKKQYINLVSLPTSFLKNFTLIEAERKNGKIVKIKFKIQSDEN
jgi:hypothetical protein